MPSGPAARPGRSARGPSGQNSAVCRSTGPAVTAGARPAAWHQAHVSNGPTEALNNLIKRVKRVAFGLRRFRNYRIRALLYAGKPTWTLLDNITPP